MLRNYAQGLQLIEDALNFLCREVLSPEARHFISLNLLRSAFCPRIDIRSGAGHGRIGRTSPGTRCRHESAAASMNLSLVDSPSKRLLSERNAALGDPETAICWKGAQLQTYGERKCRESAPDQPDCCVRSWKCCSCVAGGKSG